MLRTDYSDRLLVDTYVPETIRRYADGQGLQDR